MTLSARHGPLAAQPAAERNFTVDGPQHRMVLEDYPFRLRAVVGGRVVLDSTRVRVLHETGHLIVPYAPLEDFDAEVLRRSAKRTHCPFKGDASYWSIDAGRIVEDAIWAYEDPIAPARWLAGLAALRWKDADQWYVEDEPAFGPHLRDPYHRVDVVDSSRPVTVRAAGRVVARADRCKLLLETGLPVRVYVARAAVTPGVLAPSDKRTECPYKGPALYFSLDVGGRRLDDAAWTYETPLPEAQKVRGDVCFLGEGIEVDVGEPR